MTRTAEQEQRKIRRKSAFVTFLVMIAFFSTGFFWLAYRGATRPLEMKVYETVGAFDFGQGGAMDFGNLTEGSDDVNTFEDPRPDATEAPAAGKPDQGKTVPADKNDQIISSPESESEVKVPPAGDNSDAKNPGTENTKPAENWDFNGNGGSNHGNSNQTGNRGTPDATVLDPNGLYGWGDGVNGLQGRKPISLPQPVYTVQQDARITYEITITADGNVKFVKPLTLSSAPDLISAGKAAIYKWKFEKIPGAPDQVTRVTISFKLK